MTAISLQNYYLRCLFSDDDIWASNCGVIGLQVHRSGRELVLPHRLLEGTQKNNEYPPFPPPIRDSIIGFCSL